MGAHVSVVALSYPRSPSNLQITMFGSLGLRSTRGGERLGVPCITCSRRVFWAEERWTPSASGARTRLVRFLSCHSPRWLTQVEEWQLLDCALHAYGKVGVALYDTLGKDSVGEHTRFDRLYSVYNANRL